MKKNLAIIGASYLQLPLIEKANKMGYKTHVFAWQTGDIGESAADIFYPISIIEKEQILKRCKEIGICGICSIASDLAVVTVNYVANNMGLNGNSMDSTFISTNKYLMRKAFEKRGDPIPKNYLVDENTDFSVIKLDYPVIVKPTDRSGSRGVFKLENKENLKKYVNFAIAESFEKKALIEEYVEGQEYSVEYISYKGNHHFLAMTYKYTTGSPHFIETAHLEPASIPEEVLEDVKKIVEHALATLNIKNGASHSEIKIDNNGNIKIIEIGARMGGDCIGSDLVYYSTGIDFVKAVIEVACGEEPNLETICKPQRVKSVYIFNQNDLDIYENIKKEKPQDILREVYIRKDLLNNATDSSNRAGCYIIKV